MEGNARGELLVVSSIHYMMEGFAAIGGKTVRKTIHSPNPAHNVASKRCTQKLTNSALKIFSARMRISGFLDNSAAIASFGLPLEPLQRILYASLERLAAKCFE